MAEIDDPFELPEEKTDIKIDYSPGTGDNAYPCLEVIAGPRLGARYPLQNGKNLVGRSSDNDIPLDDSSVSRQHAEVVVSLDGVVITDLGSRNGTKVKGAKIGEPKSLVHKDTVKVGVFELRFLTGPESPPPPPQVEEEPQEEPAPPPQKEDIPEKQFHEEGGGLLPAEREEMIPAPADAIPPYIEPRPPRRIGRAIFLTFIIAVLFGVGFVAYRFWTSATVSNDTKRVERAEGEVGGVTSGETPGIEKSAVIPLFLDFKSNPISAKVFFGEKLVGQTPLRFSTSLEGGKTYEVKALFELAEIGETMEVPKQFSVEPGTNVIPVDFKGEIGILKVVEIPRDVQIYLEGSFNHDPDKPKSIKFSEVIFNKPIYLPYGKYSLELRRSKRVGLSQTFLDETIYRRGFEINEGSGEYLLSVKPEEMDTFPVKVTSIPTGANVYIDANKVGTTPFDGIFPLGEHIMILRREGYFDYQEVVKMDLNAPYTTEIKLETSETGQLLNKANELMKAEQYQEALGFLVEALKKTPTPMETAQANYLAGSCYLHLGNLDLSYEYFVKSLDHPDFEYPARLGIANVYFARDDKVRSLQLLVDVLIGAKDEKLKSDAAVLFQRISPLKSVLYITTEPVGAQVLVNSQEISEKTPLILHDLGFGTYRIVFKKAGYMDQEMKLNLAVSEFRPVFVTLRGDSP